MSNLMSDERVLSRPMNVEQIVAKAQNFAYNPLIPFKYWLRTAGTILKEAEIYQQEGNEQQTYLLLYRHAQLVLNHLSISPEALLPQNKAALAKANKDLDNNLKLLATLRPRINKRYERYEQLMRERDARRAATAAAPHNSRATTPTGHKRGADDHISSQEVEPLAAGENRDLAVQLAHREIKRRALARKPTRQAGIPEEVEHERRTAGVWGNWEEALTKNNHALDRDTLSRQMQGVRSQVNSSTRSELQRQDSKTLIDGLRSKFSYPVVPEYSRRDSWRSQLSPEPKAEQGSSLPDDRPPKPPPKDAKTFFFDETPTPPERPEKEVHLYSNGDASHNHPLHEGPENDLKPSGFTFKASAQLENGTALRTIFLPPDLRHQFLKIALPNTQANRETCGILCGTLISNALFISKLVVPDQESTSDTCEMINESALFDYVDGEDLLVLGWIHTHPTQTCFMSSRDLHTHGGYQVMLPESIAIVCAPSKGDWGVFRLTDPPGMKVVLNCTQTGLFHPHAESHIYTDALRPGHVFEAKGLEFQVVDLRPR